MGFCNRVPCGHRPGEPALRRHGLLSRMGWHGLRGLPGLSFEAGCVLASVPGLVGTGAPTSGQTVACLLGLPWRASG